MTSVAGYFHKLIEPYSSFAPGIQDYCLPFLRIPSVDVKAAQMGNVRKWVKSLPGKSICLEPKSFYIIGADKWIRLLPFSTRGIARNVMYDIHKGL
jgi:hypothetical protein